MKLSDRHNDILRKITAHGSFRPYSKDHLDACFDLMKLGLVDVGETIPATYTLTPRGETVAADVKTLPKSARVYVFATHAL
jgi:hypothetical protein